MSEDPEVQEPQSVDAKIVTFQTRTKRPEIQAMEEAVEKAKAQREALTAKRLGTKTSSAPAQPSGQAKS